MDLYMNGHTQSGVYRINPFGNESQINVYCDMETEGGGWTAIQKRRNGRVSFNKTWAEYKTGFGNTSDSYWIGNDVIHQLTKGRNSFLYISITRKDDIKYYELYDQFAVADESDNYTLFLGGPYMGTLGDNMLDTGYTFYDLSGMSFSTPDRDNDRKREENCASEHNGDWRFNKCHYAYLNGPWYPERWTYPWVFKFYDGSKIKETTMMIKPH
ncbi:fibroleukin-like [Saccostrea echinata]|uniref:fibroleukin-like n=1 Tax=Saccostrea echinata TaxID=191078 RepID=UPI002A7F44DA|nr:fibroleukin-like [Saccostrea echinata]